MSNRTFYASTYVVADGVTRTWPFSFAGVNTGQESGVTPYLYPEDVKVQEMYTDAAGNKQTVQRTGVLSAPNQLTIDGPAVLAGREIRIYRETELRFPLVDYRDLQSVSEHDLDLANRQAVFIAQETRDTASANLLYDAQGHYNAMERRIVNLADAVDPQDAATLHQVTSLMGKDQAQNLRVPEAFVPALPPANLRRDRLMGFDFNGDPIAIAAGDGSATALALQLAAKDRVEQGAAMIGRGVVVVDTVADMLLQIPRADQLYYVVSRLGGWGAEVPYIGPQGGGEFKWLPSSTLADDSGIVFKIPTVGVGRFIRTGHTNSVRPEWYGALGNGVVDDTPPLRMACRSDGEYQADYGYTFRKEGGRRINLRPGGNYRITRPVHIRKGDWLKGGGYTASRIFSNQAGIGQLLDIGWGLIDGVRTRDPGGLIPKVSDLCLAETVGGVSAIFLDSISGWAVSDCWFFADVGVRTRGVTNDGFMLNCIADNGSGHLAIFEGTGDGYHTGQSTTVANCGAFKTRYGGIKLDGVSDITVKGGFFNFVPFYGVYTGSVKKNSRVKLLGVNFKGSIDGVGMDTTQQHIRVTAPTDGFAIVDCGFAYSRNADIQANYPVQVRGGYSIGATIDSIVCLGGRTTVEGTEFSGTGRYPVRSTVRVDLEGLTMKNPLAIGVPTDTFARGAIYLTGTADRSTVFNCKRRDDKGPVLSTNGVHGIVSSGNVSEATVDVLHYTGNGVNYTINERAENPVGLWRCVERLRGDYTRWIDATGRMRIKNGDPTKADDGTVVGEQTDPL